MVTSTPTDRAWAARPLGRPIRISGRDSPWHLVPAALRHHGTAVVWARTEDWRPDQASGPRLRKLLGRDWTRYLELSRPDVRSRFAASRVLLKYAAGAALDVPADTLELGYRSTGRPYLRGNDALDVSLSHTDGLLMVGLTTNGFIGVDVEDAHREFYEAGLARHWCTPEELGAVAALAPERRDPELVRLWTLKEAYSKALGLGMQFRFTDFGFDFGQDRVRVGNADRSWVSDGEWAFQSHALTEDFTASVAVYDVGFGRTRDVAAHTMLEFTFVDAVAEILGGDEDEAVDEDGW
jgi:4'-phosphopantetheinyl transferase